MLSSSCRSSVGACGIGSFAQPQGRFGRAGQRRPPRLALPELGVARARYASRRRSPCLWVAGPVLAQVAQRERTRRTAGGSSWQWPARPQERKPAGRAFRGVSRRKARGSRAEGARKAPGPKPRQGQNQPDPGGKLARVAAPPRAPGQRGSAATVLPGRNGAGPPCVAGELVPPRAERPQETPKTLPPRGTWCSGITPVQHAGRPGFSPQCVHGGFGTEISFSREAFAEIRPLGWTSHFPSFRGTEPKPVVGTQPRPVARNPRREENCSGAVAEARVRGAWHREPCAAPRSFRPGWQRK